MMDNKDLDSTRIIPLTPDIPRIPDALTTPVECDNGTICNNDNSINAVEEVKKKKKSKFNVVSYLAIGLGILTILVVIITM